MKSLTNQTVHNKVLQYFHKPFLYLFPYLLLMAAFISMPGSKVHAQAIVTDVTFTQFDRYDTEDKLLFQNSSLGQFSFSAIPDKASMYYLSIFAKTRTGKDAWIVQNLPVSPDVNLAPIACQSVFVDFKLLEVQPGTLVSDIQYSVNISTTVLQQTTTTTDVFTTDNPNTTITTVNTTFNNTQFEGDNDINNFATTHASTRKHIFNSAASALSISAPQAFAKISVLRGKLLNELSNDYTEATDVALYTNTGTVAVPPVKDREIPGDVEEDPNGCVPGAFARSIAWLSGKYNFKAGKNPQDIYDTLKKRMDTCTMPSSNPCKIKVKSDYLKEVTQGKGTTRRIMPVTNPADSIKKYPDCDIEVDIQQLPGENIGHFIVVVSIECGTDGCCTIKYRDDSLQGKPGGDKCVKTAKICGDSITTDKKRKIRSLVIECVSGAVNREAAQSLTEKIILLPNVPNPFSNTTTLRVNVKETGGFNNAQLIISNDRGATVQRIKLNLHKGLNEIQYQPLRNMKGVLYCTLEVDGTVIGAQKMFAQ